MIAEAMLVPLESQKERDVEQLLKDYRAYWSPFGSARPLEDTGVVDAAYGPAGYIYTGALFDRQDRRLLAESYEALEHALTMLKIKENHLWLLLLSPYLGDPADPSIVDRWREHRPGLVDHHDRAIKTLARYLKHRELYPVYPKLMSEKEEARLEAKNAEVYAVFQRIRVSGVGVDAAKRQAADACDVPLSAVERIVEFRSDVKPDACQWGGCDRAPFSQNLCMRHYAQARRRRLKEGAESERS